MSAFPADRRAVADNRAVIWPRVAEEEHRCAGVTLHAAVQRHARVIHRAPLVEGNTRSA